MLYGGVKILCQRYKINSPILVSCDAIFYPSSDLELVAKQSLLKAFPYKRSLTPFPVYTSEIFLALLLKQCS